MQRHCWDRHSITSNCPQREKISSFLSSMCFLNEGVEKKFETNQKEAAIFAHGGCNLLEAEAQKLGSEDGKQVRCDLQMKSLALAHFSESGKSGCN